MAYLEHTYLFVYVFWFLLILSERHNVPAPGSAVRLHCDEEVPLKAVGTGTLFFQFAWWVSFCPLHFSLQLDISQRQP